MSHEHKHYDYPEKVNKREVENRINTYVSQATWQEGGHGLVNPIRWVEGVICDDYDAAYKWIEDHDRGDYDQIAVRYFKYPPVEETKKYQDIKRRKNEATKAWVDLRDKIHYKGVKSAFVGCKKCGSKLATAYIERNYCPLCHEELRPESTLERIKALETKAKKLISELKAEERKLQKKQESKRTVRWLVKIEYHM